MKWNMLKNAISKTFNKIKNNPSKVYKDVKHFIQKHPVFGQAYEAAKLGLEASLPEVIPIIGAVEEAGKYIDKFIEENSERIDQGAQALNRFL